MYPDPDLPGGPPRPTTLPFILGLVVLGGFLVFLILVSGGFFLWVVLSGFAVFGVGLMHYLMWGQRLHQQTEGQREEERLRQETEEDRW
jgi:hypothetical protein